MGVSKLYLFKQGPMLRTLAKTALSILNKPGQSGSGGAAPGIVLEQTLPPRDPKLVADFIRYLGGQPANYKGTLPAHYFPQWGFPLLAKTLDGLPYNMSRMLNGGCSFEILKPLPINQPLAIKAQLIDLDDNGYRVVFNQKLTTGTIDEPECIISNVTAILPLKKSDGPKKEKPIVPQTARAIDTWKLSKNTGLDFALLTGDFNPVHWVPGYAKMSGFKNTIMHGFGTMARTVESLNRSLWTGRADRLGYFEARFVKPLVFPGTARVFIDKGTKVFVGHAPGGPAYLTGNFTSR